MSFIRWTVRTFTGTVLDLSVVGIEAIVIFIVDTYRSM